MKLCMDIYQQISFFQVNKSPQIDVILICNPESEEVILNDLCVYCLFIES